LLTSQKLLQDQYEREFGAELQLVKGRDNYRCERYQDEPVPTSRGMCRRPRGPACQCPYARAKAAALAGPVFCTNLSYFATLRYWRAEQLRRRRLLVVDEAHGLEGQLVNVFTVAFPPAESAAWFGGPLPRLDDAEDYRNLLGDHLERMEGQLESLDRALEGLRPAFVSPEHFLSMPPARAEQELLAERETLEAALARIEYRPVGALAKATLTRLEPALFAEVAAILAEHPREKGLIHAPSYAAGRRLVADLTARGPALARRIIWVESAGAKARALELHR